MQAQPWFPVASWFGQIMPVFFVLGGFASLKSWRSVQRRGGSAADFYRARLLRLASPALAWYVIVGGLLWAAVALGFPFALGDLLAGGLGMPLWFLAAYLITQALVPGLARAHDVAPLRTVGLLLSASLVVDLARYASGVTAIGLLNLVFVWALVQQLGFFFADGSLHRIPRRLLPVIAVVAFAAVGLLGLTGRYSPDMLTNLNPPTVPLVLIGVGQTALFLLLQPSLDRLMATRPAQAVVLFLGTRLMTIYLWHLLLVILVAALVLVAPRLPPCHRHRRLVVGAHPGRRPRARRAAARLVRARPLRARPTAYGARAVHAAARGRGGAGDRAAVLRDAVPAGPARLRLGRGDARRRRAYRPRPGPPRLTGAASSRRAEASAVRADICRCFSGSSCPCRQHSRGCGADGARASAVGGDRRRVGDDAVGEVRERGR